MKLVFIFDNCDSQKVNKEHIIKFNIKGVKGRKKLRVYECQECDIIVSKEANKQCVPFGVQDLATTVFKNILNSTITGIEIIPDEGKSTMLYVPSYLNGCKNLLQHQYIDANDNLYILCKNIDIKIFNNYERCEFGF